MSTKQHTVNLLLADYSKTTKNRIGQAYAPSNIALCKYWGKRDTELNLPTNSSLSISLADKGATCRIQFSDDACNHFIVNGKTLDSNSKHAKKLSGYVSLFRFNDCYYTVMLDVNIPFAAGLASSACIFASLAKAINNLYQWNLDSNSLSILARLGSGSASRSIDHGFHQWDMGNSDTGLDSFASTIPTQWNDLRIGLCILSDQEKSVGSREGMKRTVDTSTLYQSWPKQARSDIQTIARAISNKDFSLLGKTAENNALAMHATMLSAWPPLLYSTPETVALMQKIWGLRNDGLSLYFTQDAGPNLKLLFLEKDTTTIKQHFPDADIVAPFSHQENNIILVDEKDNEIGLTDKVTAHQQGLCHRAFSVFIFAEINNEKHLLLQQRQHDKYHCGGLWTNTCCSHPRPGEDITDAGKRRLFEEMGITYPLQKTGEFHYTAKFDNGLTENEYDHVLVGFTDKLEVNINPGEVAEAKWIPIDELQHDLNANPEKYTPWFQQALDIALI